ncbi:hypothetical protein [Paenibacillus campi]|uniref:hypothetical protein n=1 Tax=Paenibacillus campi TaxID=3106031 RepID=UPI002AFDE23B|nr:hypothetical protein [Paenibacillus sp. SGZ-1009]
MQNQPTYAQNIIVHTKHNNTHQWFVTDKELWFLDLKKFIAAYIQQGWDIPNRGLLRSISYRDCKRAYSSGIFSTDQSL